MPATAASLKDRVQEDVKDAMRARDKRRLGALRLVSAAIKQREVDERTALGDPEVLAVLDKMLKQRQDSLAQYEQAGRADLAAQEAYEIEVIREYLPAALRPEDLAELIDAAFAEAQPSSMRDMGRVMAILRPQVQGRADMGQVSALVRERLQGS